MCSRKIKVNERIGKSGKKLYQEYGKKHWMFENKKIKECLNESYNFSESLSDYDKHIKSLMKKFNIKNLDDLTGEAREKL